jgi:hypothetical protein
MEIKDELLDIDGIKKSNKPLIDLFIRRTAVLTSTPEWLVEKIVKDQWKQANKKTQDDSEISEFDFPNLGTFYISSNKANKRIKRQEKHLRDLESKGPDTDPKGEKKRQSLIKDCQAKINSIKFKTKQLTNED